MKNFENLTCPNCNHTEKVEKINLRKESKIFLAKLFLVPLRNMKLQVHGFMCFSCNHITHFAADPTTIYPLKSTEGVEYFETYKYDSVQNFDNYNSPRNKYYDMKRQADDIGLDHVIENFKKLK